MIITKILFIFSTAAIYVSIVYWVYGTYCTIRQNYGNGIKLIKVIKNNIQLKDSNKLDPIYELMPTNGGSWNENIFKNL